MRGRYAEKHVARNVRDVISAESGANDGLGCVAFSPFFSHSSLCYDRYPFIFLPMLLMRQGDAPLSKVMGEWVVSIWIYDILLSCAIGAFIGFVARYVLSLCLLLLRYSVADLSNRRKTLKEAHRLRLVDHESLYVAVARPTISSN